MGVVAESVIPSGNLMLMYADKALAGIRPEDFGRMPKGVNLNSPAFNFGHLSTYPDMMLEMLGRKDLMRPKAGWDELFSAKAECRDDPDGTIYPPMEEIVAQFRDRHRALLGVIGETGDEAFAGVNPYEPMRDMFPTLGAMTEFIMVAHTMMHLGQVSAWRRLMGLGPCM